MTFRWGSSFLKHSALWQNGWRNTSCTAPCRLVCGRAGLSRISRDVILWKQGGNLVKSSFFCHPFFSKMLQYPWNKKMRQNDRPAERTNKYCMMNFCYCLRTRGIACWEYLIGSVIINMIWGMLMDQGTGTTLTRYRYASLAQLQREGDITIGRAEFEEKRGKNKYLKAESHNNYK